ncbi:aldehyde dehydrogenase family protein [Streptosporangium vulgare]|uniref:aldehyde dehydrogenase family protein n=1 Tax=Streptosporangium vulgare TaxID=46190 RepID=UPI0031CE35DF
MTSDGKTREITAPFTGEVLARCPSPPRRRPLRPRRGAGGTAGVGGRPARERAEPFLRLHDAILDRREEILDVVQWRRQGPQARLRGGPRRRGLHPLHARRAPGPAGAEATGRIMPVATRTVETRQHRGDGGPDLAVELSALARRHRRRPALLAGNAVVHKPDTQTALSTLWTIDLLVSLGMPREIWQVAPRRPAEIGETAARRRRLRGVHRLHPGRPEDRRGGGQAADRLLAGARRQEPRCSCSDARRPGRGDPGRACAPASPTPGSCACPSSGSTSTTPCTTSSWRGSCGRSGT